MEPRTPELDQHEYLATVDAWLTQRERRIRRRHLLRWWAPWPLGGVAVHRV